MTDKNDWATVGKRGKVRYGGPNGGSPPVTGVGTSQGQGGGVGSVKGRTKLNRVETRAKINEQPNTVVMECREFLTLPPSEEMAIFMYMFVLGNDDKGLMTEVEAVYMDEYNKKYLIKMSSHDTMERLVNLLAAGVSWPGYMNEKAGRNVIVHGYSMENPIMEITISRVGWWTTREMIRKAVEQWGEVQDIAEGRVNNQNFSFKSDVWTVKLIKKAGVEIPGLVHHLLGLEEREVWKVWYKGVPKVCYGCLQHGHIQSSCKIAPVTLDTLGSGPAIGEPEVDASGEMVGHGANLRTFAQVLRGANFKAEVETRLAQQKADEEAARKKEEEKVAKDKEVREERERLRREKDKKKIQEKKDINNDEDKTEEPFSAHKGRVDIGNTKEKLDSFDDTSNTGFSIRRGYNTEARGEVRTLSSPDEPLNCKQQRHHGRRSKSGDGLGDLSRSRNRSKSGGRSISIGRYKPGDRSKSGDRLKLEDKFKSGGMISLPPSPSN